MRGQPIRRVADFPVASIRGATVPVFTAITDDTARRRPYHERTTLSFLGTARPRAYRESARTASACPHGDDGRHGAWRSIYAGTRCRMVRIIFTATATECRQRERRHGDFALTIDTAAPVIRARRSPVASTERVQLGARRRHGRELRLDLACLGADPRLHDGRYRGTPAQCGCFTVTSR